MNEQTYQDRPTLEQWNELVGSVPRIVCGSYTGDGVQMRTIEVGFTPKAVLLFPQNGVNYISGSSAWYYGGLAATGNPAQINDGRAFVEIVEGGFRVAQDPGGTTGGYRCTNERKVYNYIAIG